MGSVPRNLMHLSLCPGSLALWGYGSPASSGDHGRCRGGRCWARCLCLVITVVFRGLDGDPDRARAISGGSMECGAVRAPPLLLETGLEGTDRDGARGPDDTWTCCWTSVDPYAQLEALCFSHPGLLRPKPGQWRSNEVGPQPGPESGSATDQGQGPESDQGPGPGCDQGQGSAGDLREG